MQSVDDYHFEISFREYSPKPSFKWGQLNSRDALAICLKKRGIDSASNDLKIVDHSYLEKYPHLTTSLSHSKSFGAAVLASTLDYPSVGIDIEFADRKVAPGATKFFLNDEDAPELFKNPLKSWTLKEAAFKALSPYIHKFNLGKDLVLKDIWVSGSDFGLRGNNSCLGKVFSQTKEVEKNSLLVSLAFLNPL